jgi:DNA-binding transcriptional regulator LsrR (DeoR family)
MRLVVPPSPLSADELRRVRLTVKIALMYHEQGMSQAQVAKTLGLSQARVSQLLKSAKERRIVETVVHVPPGMFSDLEDQLERTYGLQEAVVVDAEATSDSFKHALGVGAAPFIRDALEDARVIGVAAWSETLLAAVEAMEPLPPAPGRFVVNVFGGFGPSTSQVYTRLIERLARLCGGRAMFLLGPGVVASARLRDELWREPQVKEVVSFYDRLSVLLVGIGALGAVGAMGHMSEEHQAELRAKGAVGDICLHSFDARGRFVRSSLDDRLLGIGFDQLKRVPRIVAVAGGPAKVEAIHAALRGGWIHCLVTDVGTARALVRRGGAAAPRRPQRA